MADIRDEQGRPIQLTDEYGRPIQLTDEHGVPMHLTGVATTVKPTASHEAAGHTTIGSELHDQTTTHDEATMGSEMHGGTHFAPTPVDYVKHGASAVAGAGAATVGVVAGDHEKTTTGAVTGSGAPVSHTQAHGDTKELGRSTSSSSSSSEDDGQGGRRKKKGIMQKIKEKLPGHNNKEKASAAAHSASTDKDSTTGGAPVAGIRVEQEHEKKGFMDKIKDKLPGHH
uniref:probable dehydrin LEA n=1 Tax=Erigeron canadensis TaxID=72917 RepID=UPI001CB93AA9|nr:probable dehydrin LEA [Erigeron canadensis]